MMATSATSMPIKTRFISKYGNKIDLKGETDITRSDLENGDMVIKLEPESDHEEGYQTSWSPVQFPPSSLDQNDDREPQNQQRLSQGSSEDSTSTVRNVLPVKVKKEELDSNDCCKAVFPFRMYRSEQLSGGCASVEDTSLMHQFAVSAEEAVSSGLNSAGTGVIRSSDGARRSVVSRRKRSLVSRRVPVVLSLTPRAKRKKVSFQNLKVLHAERGQSQKQLPGTPDLSGTVRKEDQQASSHLSSLPETASLKPDKPVVRTSGRGHRRNQKPQIFVCAECGMSFRWPSRYNEHLRKHSGERPFICRECGDAFTSSSYLRIHARKHNGLLPYPCTICGEAFLHGRLLTEHRRIHAEEGAFTCEDCGLKCWSPSELSKHRQREHPDNPSNKPFTCRLCPAAFQRSYHLETHMRSHTGEKPFKCELCGLSYTTQGSLKVHTRTHTGERPFACNECNRAFITSGQLKKHARTHNRPIVTVSQDNTTVYVQTLKSVDPASRQGGTGEGTALKLEIQCFPKDSTYSCNLCGEVFIRSIDFALHMRHDHPQPASAGQKENMCRECGQVFSRAHTLKVHLRSHAGIRPFKCDTCGKQFTQRSNLNAHLRSHSQHKPFKCSVCGVSYSSAKYREIHMRSHGELRPCECIVCGSTFSSNTLLSTHMRSHDRSEVAAAFALSTAFRELMEAKLPEVTHMVNGRMGNDDLDDVREKTDAARGQSLEHEEADTRERSPRPEAEAGKESVHRDLTIENPLQDSRSISEKQKKRKHKDAGSTEFQSASRMLSAATDSGSRMLTDCVTDKESETLRRTDPDCQTVKRTGHGSEAEERDSRNSEGEASLARVIEKSPEEQIDHHSSDTETES